jgi:hypothetical protein
MNYLKFLFRATECNGWPKLKFLIDLDIIEHYNFSSDTAEITIPINLLNGDHFLIVELYGKNKSNTIVDAGNIIKDQTVELVDIYVDDILLPDFYKWMGIYKCNDNDETLYQSLLWGVNGTWKWDIKTPLISWLLEKKIELEEKHNLPAITWSERSRLEQEKIQKFEEQLSKL